MAATAGHRTTQPRPLTDRVPVPHLIEGIASFGVTPSGYPLAPEAPRIRLMSPPVTETRDRSAGATAVRPADRDSARVAERLERSIGTHKYGLWFARQTRLEAREGALEVAARTKLVADWIGRHYGGQLAQVADEVLGHGATVQVSLRPELFSDGDDASAGRTATGAGDPGRATDRRPGGSSRPASGRHAGFGDADRAGTDASDAGTQVRRRPATRHSGGTLDAAATEGADPFGSTVVGPSNRLAVESARALAEGRSPSLKLLFLHGRCGVGKTHLLHAIAQRRLQAAPAQRIRYLTAEQFTNDYITAVRDGALDGFRRRIRRQHLLVIDDIHFLASKSATQTEFQHTLDEIAMAGGAVVLASDGHPRQIQRLGAGLVSRFLSGMVVRIDEPDHAMRMCLAERFAGARGLCLSPQAIQLVADRTGGSVREIEGAVSALAALQMLSGRPASEALEAGHVTEALGATLPSLRGRPVRIGDVIEATCATIGISREDLLGDGRHRRVVAARGLAAYLAREMTTMSFPEIAAALGRSTHSTIHAAAARFREALESGQQVPCADGSRSAADAADHARRAALRGGD